jgi:hypothetical protein
VAAASDAFLLQYEPGGNWAGSKKSALFRALGESVRVPNFSKVSMLPGWVLDPGEVFDLNLMVDRERAGD